jgi:hypothetical protein
LIFRIGSGGYNIFESEKLQGTATMIRNVLISLILQPHDQFIHQLRTVREEFFLAVPDHLVNLNVKFLAQAQ